MLGDNYHNKNKNITRYPSTASIVERNIPKQQDSNKIYNNNNFFSSIIVSITHRFKFDA